MLSNVCKVTAGRLRPHFIDVCRPNITVGGNPHPHCQTTKCFLQFDNSQCGSWASPVYVEQYACLGNSELFPDEDDQLHRQREARLSFLSGHSSLAWYGMVFGVAYLQSVIQSQSQSSLFLSVIQASLKYSRLCMPCQLH